MLLSSIAVLILSLWCPVISFVVNYSVHKTDCNALEVPRLNFLVRELESSFKRVVHNTTLQFTVYFETSYLNLITCFKLQRIGERGIMYMIHTLTHIHRTSARTLTLLRKLLDNSVVVYKSTYCIIGFIRFIRSSVRLYKIMCCKYVQYQKTFTSSTKFKYYCEVIKS